MKLRNAIIILCYVRERCGRVRIKEGKESLIHKCGFTKIKCINKNTFMRRNLFLSVKYSINSKIMISISDSVMSLALI